MRVIEGPASRSCHPPRGGGFTLIELMLVVSIIAILASIALPKFADLVQKSNEGGTMGRLASLRSALSIYYADNQGTYPSCAVGAGSTVLSVSLSPNYISSIQQVQNGLHPPTNSVYCDSTLLPGSVHDGQGWYYDGTQADSLFGSVYVACDHLDTKGNSWTNY